MQRKIVYAGVTNTSFVAGSEDLAFLAEADVPAKQVERITKGIGLERCDERDRAAAAYLALPLVQRKAAPPGVSAPAAKTSNPTPGLVSTAPSTKRSIDTKPIVPGKPTQARPVIRKQAARVGQCSYRP